MDKELIEKMKQDVRYAAVNGCPPPSDKYHGVIQKLRDVTGGKCHADYNCRIHQHDYRSHATLCEVYVHEESGLLDYPNSQDKHKDHDFVKSKGGVVWALFIEVSWLGDYAAYNWNVMRARGTGESRDCRVKVVKEAKVPASLVKVSNPFLNCFKDMGFAVFPYESLGEQVDWVDDLAGPSTIWHRVIYKPYQKPSIGELLFGSPGLYIDIRGLNF